MLHEGKRKGRLPASRPFCYKYKGKEFRFRGYEKEKVRLASYKTSISVKYVDILMAL
jgi:hypothetical protein